MVRKRFFMAMACVAGAALPAMADEDYDRVCEEKGTNGMVTMLACPEGLETEVLVKEGQAACGERMPCGAWVWSDPEFIPAEAPDAHDKLPQESVRNAIAIWVNEDGKLISLAREEK